MKIEIAKKAPSNREHWGNVLFRFLIFLVGIGLLTVSIFYTQDPASVVISLVLIGLPMFLSCDMDRFNLPSSKM